MVLDIFLFLVAVLGTTYSYTVGIDRVDASLLCDPNDDSISLGGLMWRIVDGGTLTNPINMFEWSNTLAQQTYQLNCPSVGNEIITVIINIYGVSGIPVVILLLFTVCPSSMLLKICF